MSVGARQLQMPKPAITLFCCCEAPPYLVFKQGSRLRVALRFLVNDAFGAVHVSKPRACYATVQNKSLTLTCVYVYMYFERPAPPSFHLDFAWDRPLFQTGSPWDAGFRDALLEPHGRHRYKTFLLLRLGALCFRIHAIKATAARTSSIKKTRVTREPPDLLQ